MKRITFLLTILISALVFTSCEDRYVTNLKKQVKIANASCPINYGIGGDLLSMKYDEKGNQVLMYFSVNEDIAGGIFLKENQENVKKQLRLSFSNNEAKQIVKDIVNAKSGITAIYKTPSTGKTVKISLSYDELKDIKDNSMSQDEINRMMIQNKVAVDNARCPFQSDEGMITAKVAIVDDYIIYYYQLDEEIYDIKEMKRNQEIVKQTMADELKKMRKDPTMQRELRLITSLGMGYQYRYFGDKSKDYVDIIFIPEELRKYLR